MVCKNCGAEFEDNLIKCPFCGAENVAESYRRQRLYVDDLRKKSNFLAALPEWLIGLIGSAMKHTAIFAVGFFLVVLLIAFVVTKIHSSTALWRMDYNIAKLERLYEAGNYEKLEEVYWDLEDTYGGSYEKYYRTADMYSSVEWITYNMERLSGDYVAHVSVEEMDDMLEDLMSALHRIDEMEAEGFIYEEEAAMLEFRQILMDGVEQHLPMDETEFQAAYDKYSAEEENDYTAEAELILQRAIGEN